MVRLCVIGDCKETDTTILSHRFPKKEDACLIWKQALELKDYSCPELIKKYVVCTRHFSSGAYRNEISNHLNTTAIPNLNLNPSNTRSIGKKQAETQNAKPPQTFNEPAGTQRLLNTQLEKKRKLECTEDFSFELISVAEPKYNVVEEKSDERPTEDSYEPVIEKEVVKIVTVSKSSQTDPPPAEAEKETRDLSVDDEFLNTLYPEFAPLSKKELIEKLLEANWKVEAAQLKLQKYEKVIKDLMSAKNKSWLYYCP